MGINEPLKPTASLSSIIPQKNRRAVWNQLSSETGFDFPELCRPFTVVLFTMALVICIAAFLANWIETSVLSPKESTHALGVFIFFLLMLPISLFAVGLTSWTANRFDSNVETVEKWVATVLATNHKRLRKDGESVEDDAWLILQHQIHIHYGSENVTRDFDFFEW